MAKHVVTNYDTAVDWMELNRDPGELETSLADRYAAEFGYALNVGGPDNPDWIDEAAAWVVENIF